MPTRIPSWIDREDQRREARTRLRRPIQRRDRPTLSDHLRSAPTPYQRTQQEFWAWVVPSGTTGSAMARPGTSSFGQVALGMAVTNAGRRRRARCQPRDKSGRFVSRADAPNWRPRDLRGRFLPTDPILREHAECARDLLAAETRQIDAQRDWAQAGINLRYDPLVPPGQAYLITTSNVITTSNATTINVPIYPTDVGTGTGYFVPPVWASPYQTEYQTGSYLPTTVNCLPRMAPSVSARIEISTQLLAQTVDPDAALGVAFEELERDLRRRIEEHMETDGAWRGWVARIVDTRWTEDSQILAAVARPQTQDPTAGVWRGWQGDANALSGPISRTPRRPSAEEFRRQRAAAAERRGQIRRTQRRSLELRRRIAQRSAERLLRSILTEGQNEQLTHHGGFEAVGSDGGHYWITEGHSGNVHSLDEHRCRRESLCIHNFEYGLPDYDHMLSQLLLVQHDEPEFRRVANITPRVSASPQAGVRERAA